MKLAVTFFLSAAFGASASAQTASSDPFTPSASDIREESEKKDPTEEIKELKDKRWIKQGDLSKPQDTSTKAKVSVTASCTDKSGREFKSTDAGYQTCLNEMQMEKAKENAGAVKSGKPGDKSKPATGVGVQYNFGN